MEAYNYFWHELKEIVKVADDRQTGHALRISKKQNNTSLLRT